MKVLDLFSGLGGWSSAFEERGHVVFTLDIDKRFDSCFVKDILDTTPEFIISEMGRPEVVLASPPCECFSVASIGTHWKGGEPDGKAFHALRRVKHTLNLIYDLRPKFWFLENPTGMLRTIIGNPPVQVYFAQYGEDRLKPTDIWGRHPKGFKDMQIRDRSLLDYQKAPRGTKKGTQGIKSREERAKIPYQLSLTVCKLCERGLK